MRWRDQVQSSFSVDFINIIELIGTTIGKVGSILLGIYNVVYAVVHFLLELIIVLFVTPLVESALWDWIRARFSDQYNKKEKINYLEGSIEPENLDCDSDDVSLKTKESKLNVDKINHLEDSVDPEKLSPDSDCVSLTIQESKPKGFFLGLVNSLLALLLDFFRTSIRFFLTRLLLGQPLW